MATIKDIPFLLNLLEDDSHSIREHVRSELIVLGKENMAAMKNVFDGGNPGQQKELDSILEEIKRANFHDHALDWLEIEDPRQAQEVALSAISGFESGQDNRKLSDLLDELLEEFLFRYEKADLAQLFDFLFLYKGFSSPEGAYYHPDNSNLISVIERKEGLQLSLAMIAVFLAKRLNLGLYGLNLPGHFMMINKDNQLDNVFDPYHKGAIMPKQTILYLQNMFKSRGKELPMDPASSPHIVGRVYRNLMNAYKHMEDMDMYNFYSEKYLHLKEAVS
ncbi:MAG: transglutaminase family protein [Bacteroidota bacterium]